MNKRVFNVLEFNKIIDMLNSQTASSLGKQKTQQIAPSGNIEEVREWQNETDEAAAILRLKGYVPLGGIFDINPVLNER